MKIIEKILLLRVQICNQSVLSDDTIYLGVLNDPHYIE